jgi:hypothetical protein
MEIEVRASELLAAENSKTKTTEMLCKEFSVTRAAARAIVNNLRIEIKIETKKEEKVMTTINAPTAITDFPGRKAPLAHMDLETTAAVKPLTKTIFGSRIKSQAGVIDEMVIAGKLRTEIVDTLAVKYFSGDKKAATSRFAGHFQYLKNNLPAEKLPYLSFLTDKPEKTITAATPKIKAVREPSARTTASQEKIKAAVRAIKANPVATPEELSIDKSLYKLIHTVIGAYLAKEVDNTTIEMNGVGV